MSSSLLSFKFSVTQKRKEQTAIQVLCVPLRLVSQESRKTAEDAEERREDLSEEHEIVCGDSAVKHFSRPI